MSLFNRRSLLIGAAATPALMLRAQAKPQAKGYASIDSAHYNVHPNSGQDITLKFQAMLEQSARDNRAVFLTPGSYLIAKLNLVNNVHLLGISGQTRILFSGGSHFINAQGLEKLTLEGIDFDGQFKQIKGELSGLINAQNIKQLDLRHCSFSQSSRSGLRLENCAGSIRECTITQAQDYAVYSLNCKNIALTNNAISDCGNGGLLVHRSAPGFDGAILNGNQIERMGARNGGTGQFGNGINVYQAHGVTITGNHITDCAFSAIRGNGATNMVATGNSCLRSGETALYAEFDFSGAVLGSNLIDGASHGISIVNFDHGGRLGTITGNLVRNLRSSGPYKSDPPGFGNGISAEADVAITGNVIEGAPLFGIGVGWGPYLRNVTVTGNVIQNSRYGIAVSVVPEAGSVLIGDNIISNSNDGNIVGHRWAEIASRDLIKDVAKFPNVTLGQNSIN